MLRQKEKGERAIQRRAQRKAEAESKTVKATTTSVSPAVIPQQQSTLAMKWADVLDDDDDEEVPEAPVDASSSDDEKGEPDTLDDKDEPDDDDDDEDDDEEEEDDEEREGQRGVSTAMPSSFGKTSSQSAQKEQGGRSLIFLTQPTPTVNRNPTLPKQPMSKKERQKVHAQELEDLDALLSQMGIAPSDGDPAAVAVSTETSAADSAATTRSFEENPSATEPTEAQSKSRARKKKHETSSASQQPSGLVSLGTPVSSGPDAGAEQAPPVVLLTREEALSALRKAAGARKKGKGGGSNVIPNSVLEEAKKKSELKKAKRKREKHIFDR